MHSKGQCKQHLLQHLCKQRMLLPSAFAAKLRPLNRTKGLQGFSLSAGILLLLLAMQKLGCQK